MPLEPPVLDLRRLADIMKQLGVQAQSDLPQWDQSPPGDAGVMLQRIFARLMEIAIERLNRVPEKNLRAFLDAMGVGLLPPSPARAPLTFSLLKGSPPTLVPKGAQAATRASKQNPALTFETAQDFTVIPAQLARAFTMDPIWDRYADQTAAIAGQGAVAFTPFVGTERMPHILYIGDSALLDCSVPAIATLSIPWGGPSPSDVTNFWNSLVYQYQSGGSLMEASAHARSTAFFEAWTVAVDVDLRSPIDASIVRGVGLSAAVPSRWLQVVLTAPFPDVDVAQNLQIASILLGIRNKNPFAPDLVFNDKAPLDETKDFYPFGAVPTVGTCLYVASREAFAKPNCVATLNVNVKALPPPVLVWEYFDGSAWSQVPSISDPTSGFTKESPGVISLVAPASTTVDTTVAYTSLFRARLTGGAYQGYPSITAFTKADTASLQTLSSPTSITVDKPSFGAVGQVVSVDGEYAMVQGISG
jgi:hypothetical protein